MSLHKSFFYLKVFILITFFMPILHGRSGDYIKDKATKFKDGKIHRFPYQDHSPRNFVISYRHSGSHFLMYMVQYFSKRVWQVPHKRYIFHSDRLDETLPPLYRCHECTPTDFFNEWHGYYFPYDSSQDKLILLLRNYKECCFKKNRYQQFQHTPKFKELLQEGAKKYYDLLACYDGWNPERRLLIRYENLLLNTEETLHEILEFLEVPFDEMEMKSFFKPKNFLFHKNRCMILMKILNCSSSKSKGVSINYHSKFADPKVLDQIDSYFENISPDLYQRYLEEYRE